MPATLSEQLCLTRNQTPLALLVVSENGEMPPAVKELASGDYVAVKSVVQWGHAVNVETLVQFEAVVVAPPVQGGTAETEARLQQIVSVLTPYRLAALVLQDHPAHKDSDADLLIRVPRSISSAEMWGRLTTMSLYRLHLAQMECQIENMQRLGKRLNRHFAELDQEMQLATRLQRDFLPREMPKFDRAHFATLFRPATWVSGDIYDVYRVDEKHVAFYVADAVGHGVAAGLLTMLIKQAMRSKVVSQDSYHVLTPGETMGRLNSALLEQDLKNSQFVTACYCLLNTETMELSYSRGGHPYPLHVTADGGIRELKVEGGLLGIFVTQDFPFVTIQLRPGEKIVLYSDGIESMLISGRDKATGLPVFTSAFAEAVRYPAEPCIANMIRHIESQEGSLSPEDDSTIVVLEVTT